MHIPGANRRRRASALVPAPAGRDILLLPVMLARAARMPRSLNLLRLFVSPLRVYKVRALVLVMMAYPGHGKVQAVFVAALGRQVEKVVSAHQHIQPARIRRV